MQYLKPSFSGAASNGRMTQTEYEIRVGLRTPDGKLVQPRKSKRYEVSDALDILRSHAQAGPAIHTSRKSR